MNSKKLLIIALSAVLLVAVVIIMGFFLPRNERGEHEVRLPPEVNDFIDEFDTEHGYDGLVRVNVDRDNIVQIIKTMSRPKMYTRVLDVTTFWDGGNSDTTVETYVSDGITRINLVSEFGTKNIVIADGKTFTWYEGDSTYSTGSITAKEDEYQMLVTYEDILDVPKYNIIDAGYEKYNGEDCIFAEYISGRLGYKTKCYVSLNTGLAVGAERWDNEKVVYTMSETSYFSGEPRDDAFQLPNGMLITPAS